MEAEDRADFEARCAGRPLLFAATRDSYRLVREAYVEPHASSSLFYAYYAPSLPQHQRSQTVLLFLFAAGIMKR